MEKVVLQCGPGHNLRSERSALNTSLMSLRYIHTFTVIPLVIGSPKTTFNTGVNRAKERAD